MSAALEVEEIPNRDSVSRLIFNPPMGPDLKNLIWTEAFSFQGDNNYCESIVWRKYVPDIKSLHFLGCKRERIFQYNGKDKFYCGSITAEVMAIRRHKNPNGHGFCVVHVPSEGQLHAHICYDIAPDKILTRQDKTDLRMALIRNIFTDRNEHECRYGGLFDWCYRVILKPVAKFLYTARSGFAVRP